tara:strand:- start:6661 stop:6987 length:327 start_codon:yes stop_codon:yes gene_type:complete
MKLVDMKQSAAEVEKVCEAPCEDQPKYPWGLEIRLNNESLKKLGIKELPAVGTKMKVTAMGVVESARESKRRKGRSDRSVEIQIEKLHVGKASAASAEDAVDEAVSDV